MSTQPKARNQRPPYNPTPYRFKFPAPPPETALATSPISASSQAWPSTHELQPVLTHHALSTLNSHECIHYGLGLLIKGLGQQQQEKEQTLNQEPGTDRLITAKEVAHLLNCSVNKVNTLARNGKLAAHPDFSRPRRFTHAAVQAFINQSNN